MPYGPSGLGNGQGDIPKWTGGARIRQRLQADSPVEVKPETLRGLYRSAGFCW